MVSGGGGNHPSVPLIFGESRDEMNTAPDLENPNGLMILMFDVGLAAQKLAQGWVMDERRARQILADNSTGEKHVSQCRRNEVHDPLLWFAVSGSIEKKTPRINRNRLLFLYK